MSIIRSIQAYNINQQASGSHDLLDPQDHGFLRAAYFAWESTAATTADYVELCKLPKGARVIGVILNSEALGDTIDIGDADDDDRIVSALSNSAYSGLVTLNNDTDAFASATSDADLDVGGGYKYTAETTIRLTPNGTLTAGKNVRGCILYIL